MDEPARALLVILGGFVIIAVRKSGARQKLEQRRHASRNWGRVIPDQYATPLERFGLVFGLVWIVLGIVWLLQSL
jgi:hypothetical protein